MTRLSAIFGDITELEVDCIVNAANSSLLGGGGVDGAIHRKAGSDLLHECRLLGGCKTGQAKLTKGYNLQSDHIIHTVGPVWNGGSNNEAELLADCYRNSLVIASEQTFKDIAFPSISCGIYGFPFGKAAQIAVATSKRFITEHETSLEQIIYCCFKARERDIYMNILER